MYVLFTIAIIIYLQFLIVEIVKLNVNFLNMNIFKCLMQLTAQHIILKLIYMLLKKTIIELLYIQNTHMYSSMIGTP